MSPRALGPWLRLSPQAQCALSARQYRSQGPTVDLAPGSPAHCPSGCACWLFLSSLSTARAAQFTRYLHPRSRNS